MKIGGWNLGGHKARPYNFNILTKNINNLGRPKSDPNIFYSAFLPLHLQIFSSVSSTPLELTF
jgi:hypothetical protein